MILRNASAFLFYVIGNSNRIPYYIKGTICRLCTLARRCILSQATVLGAGMCFYIFFFICVIVFFVYFWRIHLIYITRQRYNSWRICALDHSNIHNELSAPNTVLKEYGSNHLTAVYILYYIPFLQLHSCTIIKNRKFLFLRPIFVQQIIGTIIFF